MSTTTIETIKKLKQQRKGYLGYIQKIFGCDRKRALQIYSDIEAGKEVDFTSVTKDATAKNSLIITKAYTFNPEKDLYIVPLKSMGKNCLMEGWKHRAIMEAYSNFADDEKSINELCQLYNMQREWLLEYKSIMGWTHDRLPVTDEDLTNKTEEELLEELLMKRRHALSQNFTKAAWKETQEDAELWRKFRNGVLDPFENALKNFKPTPSKPLKPIDNAGKQIKNTFVVGLSDIHFGARASASELVTGEDYNADVSKAIIKNYIQQIHAEVADRSYRFEKCVIIVAGDILHSLSGRTEKGTVLETDVDGDDQLELAFDSLHEFFSRMLEIFGRVSVYAVKGNHAGSYEYALMRMLENIFSNDKRIDFTLSKARTLLFKEGTTAIMLDHGESDFVKAKIPQAGNQKEAYVQSRFMQQPEVLIGTKAKIMIQGDLHHFEQKEFRDFEFIMFSSPVTGDKYSDHLGLNSRPRQNCLILDKDGLKEVLHFYFE